MFALLYLAMAGHTFAHGGRTNAEGCHNERKSGGYHCHEDGSQSLTIRASEPNLAIRTQMSEALEEAKSNGRAFSYVYRREDWKHWSDFDNDCMNTRHEMLLEQADGAVQLSPDGCYVSKGKWDDPFSGKTFTRPSELDVDHLVPLKWANGHGGDKWSALAKEMFANDPVNLLVVHDRLNQEKGAKGPDEWLPPNHAYRCGYLKEWQKVLAEYPDLKLTPAEGRVFNKQVDACRN